jgi:hypothetical protein
MMVRFRFGMAPDPGPGSLTGSAPSGAQGSLRAAGAVVAREPSLWALGALSFAVRGGWLLLAVPIITFPEEGQLSTIFGPVLTTSGPSSALVVLLAISAGLALVLALAGVLLAAYAEVSAFDRTVHRAETIPLQSVRAPREVSGRERRSLVTRIAAVQALGLVVILAVAGLVGRRVPSIVIAELQLPSNSTDSLVTRVLGQIRGELLVLAVVVVLVDIAVAIASRRLMARRFGLSDSRRPAFVTAARRIPRLVLTAAACWAITFAVVASVLWLSAFAWSGVRDVFLAPGDPDGAALVRQLLILAAFVATWVGGLALAGLSSALRAALWTASYLR